jgi:hypothetical protein
VQVENANIRGNKEKGIPFYQNAICILTVQVSTWLF